MIYHIGDSRVFQDISGNWVVAKRDDAIITNKYTGELTKVDANAVLVLLRIVERNPVLK